MEFSFVQITDQHLTAAETDRVHGCATWQTFRAVLRHVAHTLGPQIDFIVFRGDLVEVASTESYRAVGQLLGLHNLAAHAPGPVRISAEGLRDCPLYMLPGNHDDRDTFFSSLFPAQPSQHIWRLPPHYRVITVRDGVLTTQVIEVPLTELR